MWRHLARDATRRRLDVRPSPHRGPADAHLLTFGPAQVVAGHRSVGGDRQPSKGEPMVRVGINGMGRIGRAYLRYATEHPDIEVVAANDVADVTAIARLLRRDSTLGRFRGEVREEGDVIVVDGRKVAMSAIHDPEDLP